MKFTSDTFWNWKSAKGHSQTYFIPPHFSFVLIKDCLIMARSTLKVYRCYACGEQGVEQNLQSGTQGLRNKKREREYLQINSIKWMQASTRKHGRATWHVQDSTSVCIRPMFFLSWLLVLWNNSGTVLLSKNFVLQSLVQFSLNYNGSFTVWGL